MAKQNKPVLPLMDCIAGLEAFRKDGGYKVISLVSQAEMMCNFIEDPKLDREQLKKAAAIFRPIIADAKLALFGENI